ncbi:uncharacterized protein LOC117167723 [Belonocnema kinseyi]|uniref:uncharacterized protein LOC117167723 n=1 Tax=Belonocnema kinseyi TaxID=2817044 RepID=UPI00143D5ABC|nr:uncharacterized protein LOC117167723 [Belonocnema kinseyi]
MKCLIAVAFLALIVVAFADEPAAVAPTQNENAVEPVKIENSKDVRDKRGVLVTSYATAPISAPVVYASYAAPVPYVYSAAIRQYPTTYVAGYPYSPVKYVL